jgi:hypothetical protein
MGQVSEFDHGSVNAGEVMDGLLLQANVIFMSGRPRDTVASLRFWPPQ